MPRISAPTVAEHHDRQLALLLAAAGDLVREGGTDALTLASLASRVGRSRASLYAYFGSTRDLLVTLSEHVITGWAEDVIEASAAATMPADRLERFVTAQVSAPPDPLLDAARRVAGSDLGDDDRRRLERAQVPMLETLLDILTSLDVDPPQRAAHLVQGAVATAHDQVAGGAAPDAVIDDTIRFIAAGLAALARTPPPAPRPARSRTRAADAAAPRRRTASALSFHAAPSLPQLFATVVGDAADRPDDRRPTTAPSPPADVVGVPSHTVADRRRVRVAAVGLLGWAVAAFAVGVSGLGAPVVHLVLGLGLVALALAAIPVVGRTRMLRGRATLAFAVAATTSAIALAGGPQRWTTALHVVFATGLIAALAHLTRVAWHALPPANRTLPDVGY